MMCHVIRHAETHPGGNPPPVTPSADIEGLLLFTLQAEPTANVMELQDVLKREKKHIETVEVQCRSM